MILSTEKYSDQLFKSLKKAKEIWVAVGLINQKGYEHIINNLDKGVTQNYLIGIHLPSDISVLKELRKLSSTPLISAKIYRSKIFFHPKVYIIKKHNGYFEAYIGSSNATNPGFTKNVEMNIKITDQLQIEELLFWFEEHFKEGAAITDEFLAKYNDAQKKMLIREKQNEKEAEKIAEKKEEHKIVPKLSASKWNEQFFNKAHYEAFAIALQRNHSAYANARRKAVKEKLLELHERIYPSFKTEGITNLKEHYHKQNIVSHYDYRKGFTKEERIAIWLHYGKDWNELKKYPATSNSFVNHIRVQIIFRCDEVGVWLVLGKDFGGVADRKYFKTQMQNSSSYRNDIFNLIKKLPSDYWIEVAGRDKDTSVFQNAEQFHNFVLKDAPEKYFIIGKTFSPDDKLLSEKNIGSTMLTEIKRLYSLYEKMKDK